MRPAGGVATAVVAEQGAIAFLDFDRRMGRDELFHPAFERNLHRRKVRVLAAREHGVEPAYRFGAQPRHRDRELRGLVFDRVEPVRIGPRFRQKPVARAQRPFKGVDPAGVLGIDRERQTIEEAATLRGRPNEQGVHRRHQPDDAKMIGKRRGRADRLTIDPAFALCCRTVLGRSLDPSAERGETKRALDLGSDGPGTVALVERHFLERGAAQTAARREKRNRFDQIGLAGAVWPIEHDRCGVRLECRRMIIAEIAERQAADTGGSHGKIAWQNRL